MSIYLPVFQQDRMRELILHLARPTQQSEWHQTQRLVNLVHIIDFTTYQRLGDPITGARYMKTPSGPVPVEISELKETMRHEGDIQNAWTHDKKPIEWLAANRQPNMRVFDEPELQVIIDVLIENTNRNDSSIAQQVRTTPGYLAAPDFEIIPYDPVYHPTG